MLLYQLRLLSSRHSSKAALRGGTIRALWIICPTPNHCYFLADSETAELERPGNLKPLRLGRPRLLPSHAARRPACLATVLPGLHPVLLGPALGTTFSATRASISPGAASVKRTLPAHSDWQGMVFGLQALHWPGTHVMRCRGARKLWPAGSKSTHTTGRPSACRPGRTGICLRALIRVGRAL